MNEHFDAVDAWLDRVLGLPIDEARQLLVEQCDEDVRREVLELLDFSKPGTDAMDAGLGRAATDLLGQLEPAREGARIGPWILKEPIGEGGMGVVYRAARADGEFDQEVAIKVLRREMRGSVLAQRFAREREILARLDHSNIARLFDGGTTTDGQPYFVLELIRDAEPLIASCDRRRLDLRGRLRLMREVCEAVDAAHRSLVVHRDLKSSNVLVDHEGRIKLVDFGIAKSTDAEARSTQTAPLMSPLSASPEQVLGAPITVASDIYQLGLLLYELLSGQHPHTVSLGADHTGSNHSPALRSSEPTPNTPTSNTLKLARSIAEDPAPPPSRIVSRTPEEEAREAARLRGFETPRGLEQALAGELDAVTLKALHKDPTRRYTSARELAAELERWLRREPVLAAPDSLAYRLRKWRQRNPLLAGVSLVATAALAALSVLSVLFIVDQQRQAAALRVERDRALHAQELTSELFAAASPVQNERIDDPVTAAEILDRGAQRLRTQMETERNPAFVDALALLAQSNLELGRYEISQPLFEEALALATELGDVASQVRLLLDLAWLQSTQHNHVDALAAAREAERRAESSRRLPRRDREHLMQALAWLDLMACRDCTQEQLTRKLELVRTLVEDAETSHLDLSSLARASRKANDVEAAIAIYEAQLEQEADLTPSKLSQLLNNLAYARKLTGDLAGAEASYRRALAIVNEDLGEHHPNALMVLGNLATTLDAAGDRDGAVSVLRKNLEIVEKAYPAHWRLGLAHESLAYQLLRRGELEEAERHARATLANYSETLGPDHDWLVHVSLWLAMIELVNGHPRNSEELLARAESAYRGLGLNGVRGGARGLEIATDLADDLGLQAISKRLRSLTAELSAAAGPGDA